MRVLVVSNMLPDAGHPERGGFVRDQVDALRRLSGMGVDLYEFPPGAAALVSAAYALQRQYGVKERRYDVVHAHFGLTAWPALAVRARARGLTVHGTDLRHPRTRLATRAVLPLVDLIAAPTPELARELPGRAAGRARVLPCGVDMERFRPIPRARARAELGLDPQSPCLLFPADPARLGKRYDRALALVQALSRAGTQTTAGTEQTAGTQTTAGTEQTADTQTTAAAQSAAGARPPVNAVQLHTLGGVPPERVPLWVNAVNAVVVPSEAEGFGLAVLEALACDVPVVATPVGVHPQALKGVEGALCAPFEVERWRAAVEPHLLNEDPRIAGRSHAEPFSAARMAESLAAAWRALLERDAVHDDERGG